MEGKSKLIGPQDAAKWSCDGKMPHPRAERAPRRARWLRQWRSSAKNRRFLKEETRSPHYPAKKMELDRSKSFADVRAGPERRLSAEEVRFLNSGIGEDS